MTGLTRAFETTDLFITELQSVCIGLCLGLGRCTLLSRPLLGFQHLGLDLWWEQRGALSYQQIDIVFTSIFNWSGSYRRVMLEDGMTSCCLGVRIQFEHYVQILQRILLQNSAVELLAVMTIQSTLEYVSFCLTTTSVKLSASLRTSI